MHNTGEMKRYQPPAIHAKRRCHECDEEALGRCPDCHHGFCQDHFPKQQHSPCAEQQMRIAQTQACYVCGTQVYPDQWSLSRTSHFVDQFICKGCGRYVCDELHTQRKTDDVVITREGLRGHSIESEVLKGWPVPLLYLAPSLPPYFFTCIPSIKNIRRERGRDGQHMTVS